MKILKELMYAESHEWVKFTGETTASIGLTDYAQNALGGIVFINLPEEGSIVTAGESFGDVESIKSVSDLISPLTGTVKKINAQLLDKPELINDDPYESWMLEIEEITEKASLLTPEEYEKHCEKEA